LAETELHGALAERFETRDQLSWDEDRQAVVAARQTRLGALVLASRRQPPPDPNLATELLLKEVGQRGEDALTWTRKGRQFQARVALLRRLEPEMGWPDLSDDWLRSNLEQWLGPWVHGMWRLDQVKGVDLLAILRAKLGWQLCKRLDELAPETVQTPAGRRRHLDYREDDVPVLAVKLQEMFGARETPRVCRGSVPVLLHLLSPAQRPVQVTGDLASFWRNSYAEVRKELRGRYPKHHWPENPLQAEPCAGIRKPPRKV
jgi:ATP-dependent helicase HrpB